jgi:L-phenylalanine/L-methionine N-acetyltransferase
MRVTVRHVEPEDFEALHGIFSGSKAVCQTMQLPLPSKEAWRKKLAEPSEGLFSLVATVDGEVVGSIALMTSPTRWRTRHVGSIGTAVRDDWQGPRSRRGGFQERRRTGRAALPGLERASRQR